jgi:parvulin-like peptidyl-prolyl isomerase
MRAAGSLLFVAITVALVGCNHWPFNLAKKEVPVTTPTSQTAVKPDFRPMHGGLPTTRNYVETKSRPTNRKDTSLFATSSPSMPEPEPEKPQEKKQDFRPMFAGLPTSSKPAKKRAETTAQDKSAPKADSGSVAPANAGENQPSPTSAPTARRARKPANPPDPTPASAPAQTPTSGPREIVTASLLQVNGKYMTVEDILKSCEPEFRKLPKNISEEAFRTRAAAIIDDEMRQQVTNSLVAAEAEGRFKEEEKKQIEEEVQKKLKEMIAQNGGSKLSLQKALEAEGKDYDEEVKELRRRLTAQRYLRMKFWPSITVSRRMIWEYYRNNKSQYVTQPKVQMQIIAMPFDAYLPEGAQQPTEAERRAARTQAQEQAKKALAAVRNGDEYGKVVKEYSHGMKAQDGGLWPLMEAGSFKETAVEQAAFKLRQGQISDVIETPTGCYIVKAVQVAEGKTIPFEDAQDEIDGNLREQQYHKLSAEYMTKLTQNAMIVQSEKFTRLAVDRAVKLYYKPAP